MNESESYQVSAVEFAALDALGEVFRQMAHLELDTHRWAPATFMFVVDGTASISHERAAAISAWLRLVRVADVDPHELARAACWVIAWGRDLDQPKEAEHPHAMMPGAFTRQLLFAIHYADTTNRDKIRRVWPILVDSWELWQSSQFDELHRRAELFGVRARIVRPAPERDDDPPAKPPATTVRVELPPDRPMG